MASPNAERHFSDGVPDAAPLSYAGLLEDNGVPVEGTRDIALTVWDDPISTSLSQRVCVTLAPGTPLARGRFRVALDDTCASGVHASPDLWIESRVGGTSLGRRKLTAVPFALEAARASQAAGSLETRLSTDETALSTHAATADAHHARYPHLCYRMLP